MDGLKKLLNCEFTRLTQNPVIRSSYELAHGLQLLVVLIFQKQLNQF